MTISAVSQTYYQGVATHFEELGTPYGGCGVPPDMVETDDFVALNVYDAPGIGTMWTRPLAGRDTVHKGVYDNGNNCGRWLKVTIGEDCINGANDGALGKEFCRGANAKWIDDKYSGATLYMIVTDACGDNNGWCRDDKFHLDLHTPSLNRFEKDGTPVADMLPLHFNNRKINWEFVESPGYTGDIEIFFMEHAKYYWPAILISHLRNGISRVEQKVNGSWVTVNMNSDMGQAFILNDLTQPYTIRVYDANRKLINGGREYTFTLPDECANSPVGCVSPATKQPSVIVKDIPVTQTISLKNGWNLISFNVRPADSTIASVFKQLDVAEIKDMNVFWQAGQPAFLNVMQAIVPGNAYLVNMTSNGVLKLTGMAIEPTSRASLQHNGWQLIGCPYQAAVPIAGVFARNFSVVKSFGGFWMPNATTNSIHDLEPGKGYWVKK